MSDNTRAMRQVVHFFDPDHPFALPTRNNSFMHCLIRAVCKADERNRDRLYAAYPAIVWAVQVLQYDLDGYTKVVKAITEEEEAPL